jgi:HK97 family phage prohead protease
MTVRFVTKDVLFDFAGMNPQEAANMDPENHIGMPDNEVWRNIDIDENPKETINHELNEDRELKAGPVSYWEVHTALQKLEENEDQNLSVKTVEVKTMPDKLVQKLVICGIKAVEGQNRTLELTGSTEDKDRTGDTIRLDGWQTENYMKNPVFLWAHDYKSPPIGKCLRVWTENGKLKFIIQFAEADTYAFADTIYKLYKGGYINACSVGFKPIETQDGKEGTDYIKQELLELSGCPIPDNANALVSARENGLITVKDFNVITKPETTEDYFRVPTKDNSGHDGHRISTIDISEKEGIKAIYCGECKVVMTYLFSREDKYGWTMEKAKSWVKEHSKSITQEQIKDELDYCLVLIKAWDFNEANQVLIKAIHTELKGRFPVSDITVGIKSLSQANRNLINEAVELCNKAETLCGDHHKAHNSYHKDLVADISECRTRLQGLTPPNPEEKPEDEGNKLLRAFLLKNKSEVNK